MNTELLPTIIHYRAFIEKAEKKWKIPYDKIRKTFGQFSYEEWEKALKSPFPIGSKLICLNPKVLHGYYDTLFIENESLELKQVEVPFITKMPGSQTFVILDGEGQSKKGHNRRFSVSTHEFNKKNFKLAV